MQDNLNRIKLAESLEELAEAGCPVDISVADMEDQNGHVEINQVGESRVFELPGGCTGYILDCEIINQTSKEKYCRRPPELRINWEDPLFEWLRDPRETTRWVASFRRNRKGEYKRVYAKSDCYCFPRGFVFTRDLVLNHFLLERGVLSPGRPLRGLLLASGGKMPSNLHHGQRLEAKLVITTSDRVEHFATMRLQAERLIDPVPAHRSDRGPRDDARTGENFVRGLTGRALDVETPQSLGGPAEVSTTSQPVIGRNPIVPRVSHLRD